MNVVMNWSRMPPAAKCQGVCFLALMVLSTALLAIYPEVDIFAHIGYVLWPCKTPHRSRVCVWVLAC